MKCPQCELVEMLVNKVDEEKNQMEFICRKCGTTVIDEIPKENVE